MSRLRILIESYVFILILAIAVAILFPQNLKPIFVYVPLILSAILFLASIKLDPIQVFSEIRNIKLIFAISLFMMVVLPVLVYFIANFFIPNYALALLLLTAMPVGMTAPLLTELAGGKVSFSLLFVVITSLIAPFTIPLVLKLLIGHDVSLSFVDMFIKLSTIIFIPFFLAQTIRFFFYRKIHTTFWTFKPIAIVLLGFLIAGVVANQAEIITTNLISFFPALMVMSSYFLLVPYLILGITKKYDISTRVSIAVSVTFTNFTLAIYLASHFFSQPNVLIPTILTVLPWSLAFIPFKYIALKMTGNIKIDN